MSAGLRAIVVALTLMVGGAFLPPTVVRSGAVLGAKSGLQARISEQRTLQVATPLFAKKDSNKESDVIEVDGIVKESLPNAKFRVELVATKAVIVCSTSGKMRKNFVRVLVGDPVKVELSPYDLTRGRITYRSRTGKAPPPPPEASS